MVDTLTLHMNSPAGCRSMKFSDKQSAGLMLPFLHGICARENANQKTHAIRAARFPVFPGIDGFALLSVSSCVSFTS